MRVLRWMGGALLWGVAILGVLSGAVFLAHLAGWVQPLVVVSGSMQPDIRQGDLLIAVPVAAADVDIGEVATLPSTVTGTLVTHRVIAVSRDDSAYVIEMAGDANRANDPEPYRVDAEATVLQPLLTIPAAGDVVLVLARPAVAIPLAVAVLALIALSLVPATSAARDPASVEEPA
ncbi:signal peptidase I [Microbacterium sp. CFBP9034]|uniref:signal peptidase I n=1 Tax=Microbacterium sp. CFBP9034 TaxID=3096540 RepID=UPI002A6A1479|nr:signal peptidase I [Microbacterium sp. CFBP9034]MDY0909424.1 signal peptidase I [Microbacterium sp. CFBP9034]